MKVLIADDSVVFRSQIKNALKDVPDVEVVAVAANGQIALDKLKENKVDLMTLDLEMPVMDGMQVLQTLKDQKEAPKVIIFSSLTRAGGTKTMEALSLGAIDFCSKPSGEIPSLDEAIEQIKCELVPKILQFKNSPTKTSEAAAYVQAASISSAKPDTYIGTTFNAERAKKWFKIDVEAFIPKIVVIASSTGGPTSLEKLFTHFRRPPRCPVLIVQHMPPTFTAILAEKLSEVSGLEIKEAKNGESIGPGTIRIAPGGYHMELAGDSKAPFISLNQKEYRNSVRPCANFLFETAAAIYPNSVLGAVITGMGEDGCEGSMAIKDNGGAVVIQDEATSVVWGMPRAVHVARAFDRMTDLNSVGRILAKAAHSNKISEGD